MDCLEHALTCVTPQSQPCLFTALNLTARCRLLRAKKWRCIHCHIHWKGKGRGHVTINGFDFFKHL